jgi:hypothetical protein
MMKRYLRITAVETVWVFPAISFFSSSADREERGSGVRRDGRLHAPLFRFGIVSPAGVVGDEASDCCVRQGKRDEQPANARGSSGRSREPSAHRSAAEAEESAAPRQNARRCTAVASPDPLREEVTVLAAAPWETAWTATKAHSAARHVVLGSSRSARARRTRDAAAKTADTPSAAA